MRTHKTKTISCTPAEVKLLQLIREREAKTLVPAIQLALDAALFGIDVVLDNPTRQELFYVKELIEALQEVEKEDS
jgi:hypothetical protein